ncbi:hypothetical protein ACFU5I_21540 [Streptomyces libani]|uniref:hypothetical protein n=1 Tax=Streptomyces nigrescens TaxID=1920 RepID=UPI0036C6C181
MAVQIQRTVDGAAEASRSAASVPSGSRTPATALSSTSAGSSSGRSTKSAL